MLSKSAFNKSYTLWKEETSEGTYEGFNDRSDGIIVSASTLVPGGIKAFSIASGLSLTRYAEEYTSELILFSLVPPGFAFKIESPSGTETTGQQLDIRYYIREGTG